VVTAIVRNNNYTVVGKINQTNGQSQINPPSSITDNGPGVPPNPLIRTIAQILAAQESFEGLLIGIQHVRNTNLGSTWPTAGKSADIDISDNGGVSRMIMRIESTTNIPGTPEPIWPKDMAGILNQNDNSSPFTSGYRLMPRSTADIFEDGALPVSLTSFTAKSKDGKVILDWVTESEVDNVGFELMRSTSEALGYQVIGWVDGQFTTNIRTEYQFIDENVQQKATYWYKLVDVDVRGVRTEHGPVSVTVQEGDISTLNLGIPEKFKLYPAYPNPFNPGTTLRFDVPRSRSERVTVRIEIYNPLGQRMKTLVNAEIEPGVHEISWDATSDFGIPAPAGVYYAVLRAQQIQEVVKITYLK
jgi:hypothetical protein